MAPEGTMQASKAGKQSPILLNYDAYEPPQQPPLHDNPKDAAVACTPWW